MRGLHRYAAEVPFRRTDFDQDRTWARPLGKTTAARPEPASRYIVCARDDSLLLDLNAYDCVVEMHGADMHIMVNTKVELEAVVQRLQQRRVHGVLRRLSPKASR